MKLFTKFSLFLLTTTGIYAQNIVWETRLLQVQLGGAVGIPQKVTDSGSRPSLPIGENGSRFELWGWKYIDGVLSSEDLIRSAEVGTYSPEVKLSISSGDPFSEFHRTQALQPFTVIYDVSKLIENTPGVPVASKMVRVEHHTDLYKEGCYDDKSIETSKIAYQFPIEKNGIKTDRFSATNITAPEGMFKRAGKERFIVYALADGDVPERIIAEESITIFPRAKGSISGLTEYKPELEKSAQKIYRSLPTFSAQILRSYPGSGNWLEICDGDYYEGMRGTKIIENSYTNPYKDEAADIPLNWNEDSWNPVLQPKKAGLVTFILRSTTPFSGDEADEELDHKTIMMDNTISVNATLTTVE